ncbi:hypothetical protein [uncultured Chryseobacterium sp.]|uniref:hypothetical protein n=1 Tax=uncultured Chryseobacterium sp. TaxID=259322 RepID=UPI0025D21DBD|nr:hypothetical protein [uncultured Chryseobacterium sp.]
MELQELEKSEYATKANGNKLKNLVVRNLEKEKNPLIEAHVDHDIGIMFMYQALSGFLKNYENNKPYLENYNVDIDVFRTLLNKYNGHGKGIKLDLVLVYPEEYSRFTGDGNISAGAEEFLYFIATPIDENDQPLTTHYAIFNLQHEFEIDKDIIDDGEVQNLITRFKSSAIYNEMGNYNSPVKATDYIYYPWADINNITVERNIYNRLYKEVKFIFGEVIDFNIIAQYFRQNPYYKFDETAYKNAYLQHEKRLTIIGKYMPDDIIGKEDFFDMGDLRP